MQQPELSTERGVSQATRRVCREATGEGAEREGGVLNSVFFSLFLLAVIAFFYFFLLLIFSLFVCSRAHRKKLNMFFFFFLTTSFNFLHCKKRKRKQTKKHIKKNSHHTTFLPRRRAPDALRARLDHLDEIPHDLHASVRDDRLRVELHPLDPRVLFVPHRHDHASSSVSVFSFFLRPRRHLEAVGARRRVDDERVVPRRQERRRQPLQQPFAIMNDGARLSVHDAPGGAHDVAAKGPADALVAHADAEERELRPEDGDGLERDARLLGGPRTGADEDPGGIHRLDLGDGGGVVGDDDEVAAEVAEVLVFVLFFM